MEHGKALEKIGSLLDRVKHADVEDLLAEMNKDTRLSNSDKMKIYCLTFDFCEDRNLFKQLNLDYINPEVERIKYFAYLVVTDQLKIVDLYKNQ